MNSFENRTQTDSNKQDSRTEVGAKADNGLLAGEFHNFIVDVEDLIKATTSLSGADLDQATAKLNARILGARESVEHMTDAVSQKARSTARITNSYVHENPWQAIGIGAGLGLLTGMLIARR
jgi:ElaB/YqjD/DUF883 family membrane-anchored ribosome-binding protein